MEKLLEAIQTNDRGCRRGRGTSGGRGSRRGGAHGRRTSAAQRKRTKGSSTMDDPDALPVAFMISKSSTNSPVKGGGGAAGRSVSVTSTQRQNNLDNGEDNLHTWCEKCGVHNIGECIIHGQIITVTDNKLPSRARLSLPSILTLKKVKNGDQEEQGVFAKRLIKPRTQFGPLEAPVIPSSADLSPGIFDVRVITQGRQERLDLSQEEACNWMMFVRPAQIASEINLAAYQLNNQIYYISTKTIHQLTELRVWYLTSYGRHFGKEPLPTTLPQATEPADLEDTEAMAADLNDTEFDMDTVGTRSHAGLSSERLMCGFCNTPFRSLSQLVAHVCRALEEEEPSGGSPRPARRKGHPHKVNSSKRGRSRAGASPQTQQIQTHVDTGTTTAVPSSTDQQSQEPHKPKKRGRPKGSKTKRHDSGGEQSMNRSEESGTERKRRKARLDCQYCERSFYSEEQHRVHEAEHTGTKPYLCEHPGCGKGFGSKFKFWRHSLIHKQPQNRQCPYCPRTFNRVDHLKNHVMTHDSNRKLWTCEKCGKQYLYRSTYMFHVAQHNAKEGDDLSCYICSSSFPTREQLVKHVKTHNRYKPDLGREKVHECPQCQKLFTTSKDVRRHMVTHTKDRSFLCEFCPQTFARKDHLRRHYKSNHKKEVLEAAAANVEHACVVCLTVFKSEEHLQYHMSSAHRQDSVQGPLNIKKEKTERDILQQQQEHFQQAVVRMKGSAGNVMVVTSPTMNASTAGAMSAIPSTMEQQQITLLTQQNQQPHEPQPSLPIQIHINQHHLQHLRREQSQQQPHNVALQPASFVNLPSNVTGTQAVEVVGQGGETYNQQSMTLKTIPCRFSPQLLAPVNTNTQSSSITPTSLPHNLRQMLSSYPQQQQQQQRQQHQQDQHHHSVQQQQSQSASQQQSFTQTEVLPTSSTPTIVSMLSLPRQDSLLESKMSSSHLQDQTGQLKPLSSQWVLSGNSPTLPDVSMPQTVTDVGDHCYATANAGTCASTGDMGLKLPSLSALPSKVVAPVTQISDMETLRILQTCYPGGLGMGVGTPQGVAAQPSTTSGSSSLQASWDTISDLVTIPLADMITPMSSTQPSVINLPVSISMPATDCTASTTTSLSQHA